MQVNTDSCLSCHKNNVGVRDELLAKAKALAAKERTTLTKKVEAGWLLRLRRPKPKKRGRLKHLPISRRTGGLRRGIDGTGNGR